MARKARRHSNTGIYHVMLRGINRQDLFHEESDYLFFLERLRLLAHPKNEKNEPASPLCDIYAYCLMTNHVHVMLATKEKELSDVVKPLAISYARYYNTKYSRCGYLDRDKILISVLQKGAGIRQLSKLSAVGFSVIRRLKNVSISPSP